MIHFFCKSGISEKYIDKLLTWACLHVSSGIDTPERKFVLECLQEAKSRQIPIKLNENDRSKIFDSFFLGAVISTKLSKSSTYSELETCVLSLHMPFEFERMERKVKSKSESRKP